MGFLVDWYKKNKIVHVNYYGDLSDAEVSNSNEELTLYIKSAAPCVVHVLGTTTEIKQISFSFEELMQNAAIVQLVSQPNLGWILHINNNNKFHKLLSDTLIEQNYLWDKMKLISSFNAALEFLDKLNDNPC